MEPESAFLHPLRAVSAAREALSQTRRRSCRRCWQRNSIVHRMFWTVAMTTTVFVAIVAHWQECLCHKEGTMYRAPTRRTDRRRRDFSPSFGWVRNDGARGGRGIPQASRPELQRGMTKIKRKTGLSGPEEVELFFDGGEVFVAGGEGGFAGDGEGGGEGVGVREIVLGAQFGSGAS
jgi:hypothetical protein